MDNIGYQTDFLGSEHSVDLPIISFEHESDVVTSEDLREGRILDYPNYSVVMSRSKRQAFYSAGNADFENNVGQGKSNKKDGRIDKKFQLGNIYYKNLPSGDNPYDKGHLTRRDAISWGGTEMLADKASKYSWYYTNLSPQHMNFNRDEWHALEKAIETSNMDSDNRFNIFVGPVFTDLDRFITPDESLEPARVPSAFWKVIVYIGKDTNDLEVNAFFVWQDDESIQAMKQVLGNNEINPFNIYQSPTSIIEDMTGIEFHEIVFARNPMFRFESDITRSRNIVTPQLNEVSTARGPDCGIIFRQ